MSSTCARHSCGGIARCCGYVEILNPVLKAFKGSTISAEFPWAVEEGAGAWTPIGYVTVVGVRAVDVFGTAVEALAFTVTVFGVVWVGHGGDELRMARMDNMWCDLQRGYEGCFKDLGGLGKLGLLFMETSSAEGLREMDKLAGKQGKLLNQREDCVYSLFLTKRVYTWVEELGKEFDEPAKPERRPARQGGYGECDLYASMIQGPRGPDTCGHAVG
ncbi:hypothetical protein BDK51DRAFT_28372 [Blyttiomyces helicus]|uniref:Uncharacterized protein n=1 Tax=Blyttiomyces helicus TaxID=388810 RepID=A0A4P9WP46_9FUNG|nr:hypothetical protein BDK51DRAFT_28372 [Blyttiomyces helicus]|eukprot:RKO92556.1 hypothetical protein BDK51DRAFT_28372 [Blyttiomyces helicus]